MHQKSPIAFITMCVLASCSTMSDRQKEFASFATCALVGGMAGKQIGKDGKSPKSTATWIGVSSGTACYMGAVEIMKRKKEKQLEDLRKENTLLKKSDRSEEKLYKKNIDKLKDFADSDCAGSEKMPVICSDNQGKFVHCKDIDLFYVSPNWVGQYTFFHSGKGCFRGRKLQPNLKKYLDKNLDGVKNQ